MKLERSDRAPFWAFLAPAIALMVVFFIIPVIYVAVVSLMKWNGNSVNCATMYCSLRIKLSSVP